MWQRELKCRSNYSNIIHESQYMWQRELKWRRSGGSRGHHQVTVHVTAWVEMIKWSRETNREYRHSTCDSVNWNEKVGTDYRKKYVTVHVTAWVEIISKATSSDWLYSHSTCDSVSWNTGAPSISISPLVTVYVTAWVEIYFISTVCVHLVSQYMWQRELKLHLMYNLLVSYVTVHVTAWVEIKQRKTTVQIISSHGTCDSVSLNKHFYEHNKKKRSHSTCDSVSWNLITVNQLLDTCVTVHVTAWVEIHPSLPIPTWGNVTVHVTAWVEITAERRKSNGSHSTCDSVSWNSL